MKLPAFFPIADTGRAAKGRRLAALAVRIKLVSVCVIGIPLLMFSLLGGLPIATVLTSFVSALLPMLIALWGFSNGYLIVGILYAIHCLFGVFGAFGAFQSGLVSAFFDISLATLDFVALSGIIIWIRNRRREPALAP